MARIKKSGRRQPSAGRPPKRTRRGNMLAASRIPTESEVQRLPGPKVQSQASAPSESESQEDETQQRLARSQSAAGSQDEHSEGPPVAELARSASEQLVWDGLELDDESGAQDEEAGDEEEGEQDEAEELEAEAILQLAVICDGRGAKTYKGKMRGGAQVELECGWVRSNFKSQFLREVAGAKGKFVPVKVGRASERPPLAEMANLGDGPEVLAAPGTTVHPVGSCPEIAYQQGRRDWCAAYGLASALLHYGDVEAAEAVRGAAEAALVSDCPFVFITNVVEADAAGWRPERLKSHDPLETVYEEPTYLQLASSDGSKSHAIAIVGRLIFDSCEQYALPLTQASLDRCAGAGAKSGVTFSHVARAMRLVPSKGRKKLLRRLRQQGAM